MNNPCISSVRSTVLALFGLDIPSKIEKPNDAVLELAERKLGGKHIDRAVIYNPDAIALWLYEKYASWFAEAEAKSDVTMPMKSVMPSVTPVCFASMYSGVMPDVHGIKAYVKPVLTVETLFDDMVRVGKKTAIVSTAEDSISKIFLDREIDYFIYPTHEDVNRKAEELIKADGHELIVIYNGNYDESMHGVGPEGEKALTALRDNLTAYTHFVDLISENMKSHSVFYGFCPDHGCHLIDGGFGSHGLDMSEDMDIVHLYGIKSGN